MASQDDRAVIRAAESANTGPASPAANPSLLRHTRRARTSSGQGPAVSGVITPGPGASSNPTRNDRHHQQEQQQQLTEARSQRRSSRSGPRNSLPGAVSHGADTSAVEGPPRSVRTRSSQQAIESVDADSAVASTPTSADEAGTASEPSAKSLGKRKAASPPLSVNEQPASTGKSTDAPARPSKRQRSGQACTASEPRLDLPSQNYNLRPRGPASTSTSKLNPANHHTKSTLPTATSTPAKKTTSSRSRPMTRRGRGAASGGGGSSSRSGNTSLRAKATANAAIAAANAANSSGRAAHSNAQAPNSSSNASGSQTSRHQYDEDLDDEAQQGIMDAREEMALQDADIEAGGSEEEEDDDEDDDSLHLIGGHSMDIHREDEDITSHLNTLSAGQPHFDDDEDDGDDIDEDDDLHGDDMLDDDFEAPLTFDADGNPIASHSQPADASTGNAGRGSSRLGDAAGAAGTSTSGADGWGSGAAASMSAAARAALAAAAAAADDDFGSFAASLRGYPSSFMGNMSSRLRGLLQNIRSKDSSVKMIALQELSEILSMSTEDTLAGYFSVDAFVKELVKCLKGSAHAAALSLEGLNEDDEYAMAEAIAAAADAAGSGNEPGSEEEMQLLACRCLANLIEAMPAAAGNIVANGAVPVLCEKLVNITVIDLAEQTISTLEKLSEEMPAAIVREGGLAALLTYLDFFSIHVQRTAVTAAARCCQRLSVESFDFVKEIIPVLKNTLSYSDSRLVEQACLAITGIVESFRHYPDKLEVLLTTDLLTAVAALLVPGQNPSVAAVDPSTHPRILKLLSTAAKSSPEIAIGLVESDIVATLYNLLTGISPPSEEEGLQGIKKHLEADDMLVLNNLVHRSKEVVQETLTLINELLPALPKDGIFDPKAHMHRSKSSKAKKEEIITPDISVLSTSAPAESSSSVPQRTTRSGRSTPNINRGTGVAVKLEEVTPALENGQAGLSSSLPTSSGWKAEVAERDMSGPGISSLSNLLRKREGTQDRRVELFHPPVSPEYDSRRKHLSRFFSTLLPILLDVYIASVGVQVRSKTFQIMLKIVHYCDKTHLPTILTIVPMASFLASCFSAKDQPALVLDALQMTELLLTKVPDTYQYFFRREGVLYELEKMADEPYIVVKAKSKRGKGSNKDSSAVSTPGNTTPLFESRTPADDGGDAGDLGTRIALAAGGVSAMNKANAVAEGLQKDSITLRAQHLKRMLKDSSATDGSLKADAELNKLRALVKKLSDISKDSAESNGVSNETKAKTALASLAEMLTSGNIMSSFEIQESGLIAGLLQFATTGKDDGFSNEKRRTLIMDTFLAGSDSANSALSQLVKRLQEALAKTEEFDVLTALPSGGDSRHNPATMLARQLKIRLVAADQADMPKSLANVIVSIHAIATFQALNDYLRPRIMSAIAAEERSRGGAAASPGNASSRLSGVLAAFAAATGMPPSEFEASVPNLANALSASAPSSLAGPSQLREPAENPGSNAGRRRSTRLSARASTSNLREPDNEQTATEAVASADSSKEPREEDEAGIACQDADHIVDDDDLLEGGLDLPQASNEERPVNFEVAADGSRVDASTPDGTRIHTPVPAKTPAAAPPPATARSAGAIRGSLGTPTSQVSGTASATQPGTNRSYAAALRAPPADWHLEFFMGDRPVSLSTTIFGACYQQEVRNNSSAGARGIWHNVYSVTFKKIPGPPAPRDDQGTNDAPTYESNLPSFLEKDPRQGNILRLLGVLHRINSDSAELRNKQIDYNHLDSSVVPGSVFVNNKLTAKLNRQLEEPMIVASECLPDWSTKLPQIFPFLFPFETRYNFLQSTSFGYARLMQRWLQTTRPDASSRRDENLSFLGRITRQKVRISRQKLFESAFKVVELYGSSKSLLEVEYFDEVGTGLGPTLEFYSLVSKEYRRKELGIWREGDSPADSEFVSNSRGLYPAPIDTIEMSSEASEKYDMLFKTLGTLVAKAQMDSRIIDFPFNKVFMKLVLGQAVPLTTVSVRAVDPTLAQSLEHLQKYLAAAEEIRSHATLADAQKAEQINSLVIDDARVEDLALDFTLPGYDLELKEGGKDMHVTMNNLSEYLDLVLDWTLLKGTKTAVAKFKEGFNLVFPVGHLHTFTPDELVKLFGDAEEDWSFTTISDHIKADHGYTLGSASITNFISFMSELDPVHRRKALSFMTGASRLPIGGFGGLNPPLTVVRKVPEDGASPDSVLPSVMTCVSFVKLPDYSSKEVMASQIMKAIDEGGSGFHLS